MEIVLSPSGINPNLWGPSFWKTLYYVGLNYPVKIDKNNKCHLSIKKHYKMFFCSLQYTLPCIFCLESYRRFWKEDDLDKYLNSRIDLLKWLYILKDKVNRKLIFQEKSKFNSEKKTLLEKYKEKYGIVKLWKKSVVVDFNIKINKLGAKILLTKPSPTFKKVLDSFAYMRE